MGSLSLLAQATPLTLAHLFVKAKTTPTPCFPLQRGCAGFCGAGMGSESLDDVLAQSQKDTEAWGRDACA